MFVSYPLPSHVSAVDVCREHHSPDIIVLGRQYDGTQLITIFFVVDIIIYKSATGTISPDEGYLHGTHISCGTGRDPVLVQIDKIQNLNIICQLILLYEVCIVVDLRVLLSLIIAKTTYIKNDKANIPLQLLSYPTTFTPNNIHTHRNISPPINTSIRGRFR